MGINQSRNDNIPDDGDELKNKIPSVNFSFEKTHPSDLDNICRSDPYMIKICTNKNFIEKYLEYWNLEIPNLNNINKYKNDIHEQYQGLPLPFAIMGTYIIKIMKTQSYILINYLLDNVDFTNSIYPSSDYNLISFNFYKPEIIFNLFQDNINDEDLINLISRLPLNDLYVADKIAGFGTFEVARKNRPKLLRWLIDNNLLRYEDLFINLVALKNNEKFIEMNDFIKESESNEYNKINWKNVLNKAIIKGNLDVIDIIFEITKNTSKINWLQEINNWSYFLNSEFGPMSDYDKEAIERMNYLLKL